jgi:3-methyladenine DNA glycosylase AlkD
MATVEDVLNRLKEKANPDNLEGMSRFGITIDRRLGVSVPDMRKMAKEFARDHKLALELWKTGIDEARILASMVDNPERVTQKQGDEPLRKNSLAMAKNNRMGWPGRRIRQEGCLQPDSLPCRSRQERLGREFH